MSTSSPSSEPSPILEILRRHVERGREFLGRQDLKRGMLQMWAYSVRGHLAKIYGKDAPELDHFLPVPNDLPETVVREDFKARLAQLQRVVETLNKLPAQSVKPSQGTRIFIGHGRSPLWRELKDFVSDRLGLAWDEFNREAVAGYTTSERLSEMLSQAAFAFLVLTAEEERNDGTIHARSNVIHEVGLFQGRLGLRRAIVLLEEGCSEFSNITGLSQIRFPRGDIAARFEEVRRVLEREGLV